VSSRRIILTVSVSMSGQMDVLTKEHGCTIKCTERGHSLGRMAVSMLEDTLKTRNKGMVPLFGQTGKGLKAIGWTVNRVELGGTRQLVQKEIPVKVCGKTESESDGSPRHNI
jgi:hypothetical protein